jgi:hypothetical protein
MMQGNPPLASWQIEHIRKMQEELGTPQSAPDVEVDEMDEIDEDTENEFAVPNAGAGNLNDLSVYGAADVRSAIAARNKLAMEQQARYDAQAKEIMARRDGPSFSERMFQLSAALATPTEQRGLGGILANVTPVLAAQQRAKRQDELSRREALEQLEANRLTQQMGLANQDVTTQLAIARLEAVKSKPPAMKSVIIENSKAYDPVSGENIVQPNDVAWADLLSDPSQANLNDFIQEFGPRFAEKAMRIVNYARGGR